MKGKRMFKCDKCGLCCMNVDKSKIYAELDRGDGICRYFDIKTKLCTIYDERPILCNIDKAYETFFKNSMSLEEYYKLNYESCKILKNENKEM